MNSPAISPDLADDELLIENAPPPREAGDSPRVSHAAAWVSGSYFVSMFLRLANNIVLSRLLFPEAFGVMAIVSSILQALEMFSDIGIGPSIVQNRRGDEPSFLNTAWTIQLVRGTADGVRPAAHLAGEPALRSAGALVADPLCGFDALLGGFNATALFTAKRHLNLKRLMVFDLSAQIIANVVKCTWRIIARAWPPCSRGR